MPRLVITILLGRFLKIAGMCRLALQLMDFSGLLSKFGRPLSKRWKIQRAQDSGKLRESHSHLAKLVGKAIKQYMHESKNVSTLILEKYNVKFLLLSILFAQVKTNKKNIHIISYCLHNLSSIVDGWFSMIS